MSTATPQPVRRRHRVRSGLVAGAACLLLGWLLISLTGEDDLDYRLDPESGDMTWDSSRVDGAPDEPEVGTWYPVRFLVPVAGDDSELRVKLFTLDERGVVEPDLRLCPADSEGPAAVATCDVEVDGSFPYESTEAGELPALLRFPAEVQDVRLRLQYVVEGGGRDDRAYILQRVTPSGP